MTRELPIYFQNGLTDKIFYEGVIWNPAWYPGSTERQYFTGWIKDGFSYKESDPPIFNFFEYDTFLLPSGYDFQVKTDIAVTGSDSYNLPFKAADLYSIARYIKTDIVTAPSTSTFTLKTTTTDAISKYDTRAAVNNAILQQQARFLCRITNPADNTKYFRAFTVSGGTFTLKDISSGLTSAISGLARNWTFELLGHYTMVPEGTEIPTTIDYGVITKNIKLGTGEASFKFMNLDKPVVSSEKLAVVYYGVENSRPQYMDSVSILQHGIYPKIEKIDFPLTDSQLAGLQTNSKKYYDSHKEFTIRYRGPGKLQEGDLFYINLSRYPAGYYEVTGVKPTILHEQGEIDGTTFDEVEYTFSNYVYNLNTVILSLKTKNDVNKAKVAQKLTRSYRIPLALSFSHTRATIRRGGPQNLTVIGTDETSVNISWDILADSEEYRIYVSELPDFSVLKQYTEFTGYSDKVAYNQHTYNIINLDTDVPVFIKVSGTLRGSETDFSETITATPTETELPGLIGKYKFDTDGSDTSGNANHGTIAGEAVVVSGELNLNGVSGVAGTGDRFELPSAIYNHIDTIGNYLTICMWVKFDNFATTDFNPLVNTNGNTNFNYTKSSNKFIAQSVSDLSASLTAGNWYFVAIILGKTAGSTKYQKIYFNGSTENSSFSNATDNTFLRLGFYTSSGTDSCMFGKIDTVRIYDNELSDSDIAIVEAQGR
jgi:hypothetical protein